MSNASIKTNIFLFAFLAAAVLGVLRVLQRKKIDKNGIYVVAVITNVSQNKNSTAVFARYYYDKKEYKVSFTPGFSFKKFIGRRFFIKLLPKNPRRFIQYNIDIPNCILESDSMSSWREIPRCS